MASEKTALLPTPSTNTSSAPPPARTFPSFLKTVFQISFIAFGGPQANTALFHATFVPPTTFDTPTIPESTFLELYALGQSLPGPGTTKLIVAIAATFGGLSAAFLTFLVWLAPSFLAMSYAGVWFHERLARNDSSSVLLLNNLGKYSVGLVAASFAIVIVAARKIVTAVCGDHLVKCGIALGGMAVTVLLPARMASWAAVSVLATGAVVYYVYERFWERAGGEGGMDYDDDDDDEEGGVDMDDEWTTDVTEKQGAILLSLVAISTICVVLLPADTLDTRVLRIFWKLGLCVYGGATVVVPLLLAEFVDTGLLPPSVFLAAFGLFGCIPGPMTNLAPFLGAAILSWRGALFGLVGCYAPGVLLQIGLLPFWKMVRGRPVVKTVLVGMNCGAAGLILAGVWMLLRRAITSAASYVMAVSAAAWISMYGISVPVTIAAHGVLGVLLAEMGVGMGV